MHKIMFFLAISLLAMNSFGSVDCGKVSVNSFHITAEKSSHGYYSNLLLLFLKDENGNSVTCSGKTIAYIENNAQSFQSIFSTILMAKATNSQLGVVVNESSAKGSAYRIEYLYVK